MRKFKTLLIAAIFSICGAGVFAADATVTFVSGKVEVQRGGKWVALQKGDTVSKSETISTGFQSEAKIKIMESVMYLGPVTRITLEELSSTEQKDNVNVYLKTGTARSQVKHIDNKRVNYQVHTAVAVASCRGTGFIIDDSNTVEVTENTVAVGVYRETSGLPAVEGETTEASADDGKTTLVSDDGVLVQENQLVTVSENNGVSNPTTTVDNTANNVVGIITTAAIKESEGGAGLGSGNGFTTGGTSNGGSDEGGSGIGGSGNGGGSTTTEGASVIVVIEAPDPNN